MFIPKCFYFIICLLPITLVAQEIPAESDENAEKSQERKTEIVPKLKGWSLTGNGGDIQFVELDTLQDRVHIFHPIEKKSIINTYTGNYGGAYEDNNFFSRNYSTDFLFLQTHDAYLLTPQNVVYYNTTTPYTLLDYSQSENKSTKNETRFNVLHTQNINPKWNFTLRFDQARSMGQYNEQYNKNNFVTAYTSYISDKTNVHAGFIANRIMNEENGGMKNESRIFDKVLLFNLIDTESKYRSDYFYVSTEYRLGKYADSTEVAEGEPIVFIPRYGFNHYIEYSNNSRNFTESNVNLEFFPPPLLDTLGTDDSVRFGKLTNIFQISQIESAGKLASFGKKAYIGFDVVNIFLSPYYHQINSSQKYTDIYVGGSLSRMTGKFWNMKFDGRFYLTGYHSGQTELSGIISKPLVLLKDSAVTMEIHGKLENRVPDYFQYRFISNHYTWYNKFNHEQRMTAGINFRSPKRNLEMGANYALINNFIYYDTLGLPAQTKKELLILSAFLNKKIVLGNFNVDTKFLVQKASSPDLVRLPEFSAYVGIYYKIVLAKVMFTQIGVDTRYNTKYYADAHSPATGFFYLQNERKIGNYPYIDAYASLKLKRTRVYFKLINVGSKFLKDEFFTALHHPMNKMTFRLGVDWKFYD